MSKWYEVTIQATKVIAVEIADDSKRDPQEEAQEVAEDEFGLPSQFQMETLQVRLLEKPEHIESAKRHADEVSELPAHNDPNSGAARGPIAGGPLE